MSANTGSNKLAPPSKDSILGPCNKIRFNEYEICELDSLITQSSAGQGSHPHVEGPLATTKTTTSQPPSAFQGCQYQNNDGVSDSQSADQCIYLEASFELDTRYSIGPPGNTRPQSAKIKGYPEISLSIIFSVLAMHTKIHGSFPNAIHHIAIDLSPWQNQFFSSMLTRYNIKIFTKCIPVVGMLTSKDLPT